MDGNVFQVYTFEEIVKYGISILFFLSSVLAFCYAIWGGFLMVVSAGNEEKVKAAVNHIRYAILGVVVLALILFVAPLFLNLFGLGKYGEFFKPAVILDTIQEVSAKMLGNGSDTVSTSTTNITVNSDAFSSLD